MAPTINYPHVPWNTLSLISSDFCTPANLRTNAIWMGRMLQGIVRYILHLYCWLLQRHGRKFAFRSHSAKFNPQPGCEIF